MNIDVVEKEGLKRELTIEVPAEVVDAAYDKVYKEMQKKAKIKGFRPGKTPMNVIRSRFKNEATAEIVEDLIGKYYHEAVMEKKLEPVGQPVLSKVEIDEGKPLHFTLGIEVMPQIEDIVTTGLKVEKPSAEIPDSDVDEVVSHMRKQAATLRAVDRAAGDSDLVICDLKPIAGAVEGLGETPLENQEIDFDNPNTVKEFRDGLAGAKRDETREIVLLYPETHPDKEFAGKSVTFSALVKEVKERVLPELTDDFAKQSGQGETMLEMRLNLRKRLEAERKVEIQRTQKKEIVDQIVKLNPFDVPDTMVESYLKNVVEDLKQHGEEIDEKEAQEQYRAQGINTVRWYLLYHRLAVQEKIEVSPEDTENWIKRFAENYRMEVPRAKEILAKTGKSGEIKDGILEEKVLDFLLSGAEEKKGSDEN